MNARNLEMQGQKARDVEGLRACIAALERRPLLEESAKQPPSRLIGRSPGILDLTTGPSGVLQEIFTDDLRNAGSALGFTLGLARNLLSPARPAIVYLQLMASHQEIGLPYAPGLSRLGLRNEAFVLSRLESLSDLFWALEECIGCQAVAAVIADISGRDQSALDFTVTRRLSLRTASAATSAFLIRYGAGREASAAKLRWHVSPQESAEAPFDPEAPGMPRFAVTLEKCRLGARAQRLEGHSFVLEWIDHGFALADSGEANGAVEQWRQAAPRPQPAPLGYRLSQAG
jgi:protein ImuA